MILILAYSTIFLTVCSSTRTAPVDLGQTYLPGREVQRIWWANYRHWPASYCPWSTYGKSREQCGRQGRRLATSVSIPLSNIQSAISSLETCLSDIQTWMLEDKLKLHNNETAANARLSHCQAKTIVSCRPKFDSGLRCRTFSTGMITLCSTTDFYCAPNLLWSWK